MARKTTKSSKSGKREPSASMFQILTLVFFILTTLVLGALAWIGYSDQKQYQDAAQAATKKESEMKLSRNEERARKVILRVALGIATEDDLKEFAGIEPSLVEKQRDELARINKGIGDYAAFPVKFRWNVAGDGPAPAPDQPVLGIIAEYAQVARAADDRIKAASAKAAADQAALAAANAKATADKASFDAEIAKQKAYTEAQIQKLAEQAKAQQDAYLAKLSEFEKTLGQSALAAANQNTLLAQIKQEKADAEKLVSKYRRQDESRLVVDGLKLDPKKGVIERVSGDDVYLNIGSAQNLRKGIKFSVLPVNARWSSVEQKVGLVKGQVEIVEVLSPNQSRARIIGEADGLRNPIRKSDELFNAAWQPGERERIAFAGVIDMNGDGIDDNGQFLRLLEDAGVRIDQWYDLRTGQFRGDGMTINTNYLVVGPDPVLDNGDARLLAFGAKDENADRRDFVPTMKDVNAQIARIDAETGVSASSKSKAKASIAIAFMRGEATRNGVQVIDARKFLQLTGVQVPRNASPADYGSSVYANNQPAAAPAPPAKEKE